MSAGEGNGGAPRAMHPLYQAWEQALDGTAESLGPSGEGLATGRTGRAGEAVEALIQFQKTWAHAVIFPRLARYFVGGGPIPVMEAEHRDLEEAWEGLDPGDPGTRQAFAAALRLHVRKESLSLLAVARVRLSRREWTALHEAGQALGLTLPPATR